MFDFDFKRLAKDSEEMLATQKEISATLKEIRDFMNVLASAHMNNNSVNRKEENL